MAKKKPKKEEETPQEAAPSAEELQKLREEAAKAEEYLDLARRTKADFLNYQQRAQREKESLSRYAIEDFVRGFLPALDAVREAQRLAREAGAGEGLLQGVELIEKEFLRVLEKSGVKPIEAVGKPFDPAFHEAVQMEPSDEKPPNTVLEEVRRGWLLHDRVLRPSMVKIALALPGAPPDKPSE